MTIYQSTPTLVYLQTGSFSRFPQMISVLVPNAAQIRPGIVANSSGISTSPCLTVTLHSNGSLSDRFTRQDSCELRMRQPEKSMCPGISHTGSVSQAERLWDFMVLKYCSEWGYKKWNAISLRCCAATPEGETVLSVISSSCVEARSRCLLWL